MANIRFLPNLPFLLHGLLGLQEHRRFAKNDKNSVILLPVFGKKHPILQAAYLIIRVVLSSILTSFTLIEIEQ
ncbi:MAG: hypothetical protein A2252_02640 [Elusimicrobia bacterium RIFOXYA2_FULL_39_19]|nr:MAG: hypothetical protein A2252_02640 [Elusimicrobia bacterium RIFOXYA2_FULL_39_19]